MSLVAGSGTSRNTNRSLQDDLGMNDWMPDRPVTGAGALWRDVEQAAQDRIDAGESWSDWVDGGGDEYYDGGGNIVNDGGYVVPPITIEPQPISIPMMTPSLPQDVISSAPPIGLSGSPGLQPGMQSSIAKPISVDEIVDAASEPIKPAYYESGLDSWEQMAAEREGRPVRTTNLFGEAYDTYEDGRPDFIGNNAVNDAYIRAAVANGLSEDDAYAIMHRPQTIPEEEQLRATRNISPDIYDGTGGLLDDGSMNYFDMTADKMTGAQYLKYADLGMGGRPTEEIVPNEVYSKRREANEYGFIPFTPDDTAYMNMVTSNVLDLPWRLGSMIGNMRETLTPDYDINYGDGQSVSGREFDKRSPAYLGQFDYFRQFDPKRYLSRPSSGDYTPMILEHAIPDASGNETYHYGSLKTVDPNPDGTYLMGFSDGSKVNVSKDYIDTIIDPATNSVTLETPSRVPIDKARGQIPQNLDKLNNIDQIMELASKSGASPLEYADVIYVPDMTLSDGTKISLNDVDRIARDQTDKDDADDSTDDDISYNFSGGYLPFASNKPKRLMTQEPFDFESGKIDLSDMINNTWDWTFGSVPISVGSVMPWLYSASGATSSINGVDPNSYNPNTDSYGLISGSYDEKGNAKYGVSDENGKRDDRLSDETRFWNMAGNAAVPFTEMIVGPVGEQIIPLEKIFGGLPINPTAGQVLKNTLIGAAGEGIEEDLGNIFEDLTQYGWQGLFANQKKDKEGNPLYDNFRRHELRDYDTSIEDRIRNALDPSDLANAFTGGAAVDFAMDALLSPLNKNTFTRQIGPALQRDMARRKTGVQQYVESEPERQARKAAENGETPAPWETLDNASYLEGFRDDVDEEER